MRHLDRGYLLLAVFAVAACSPRAAPHTSPPSSGAAGRVTVQASPSTWTLEQARQRFLTLAGPVDKLYSDWNALPLYADQVTIEDTRQLASKLVEAEAVFAEGLTDAAWPDAVQPLVHTLADDCRNERAVWQQVANARTTDVAYALYNNGGFAKGAADENAVGSALGV